MKSNGQETKESNGEQQKTGTMKAYGVLMESRWTVGRKDKKRKAMDKRQRKAINRKAAESSATRSSDQVFIVDFKAARTRDMQAMPWYKGYME